MKEKVLNNLSNKQNLSTTSFSVLFINKKPQAKLENTTRKEHRCWKTDSERNTDIAKWQRTWHQNALLRIVRQDCTQRILNELPHNITEVYWRPKRKSSPTTARSRTNFQRLMEKMSHVERFSMLQRPLWKVKERSYT